jgi:hypothetical protein
MTPDLNPSPVPPATPEQGKNSQPRRESAVTTLTNYLIVSGMLACAAIGAVQLGLQLSPTWKATYVPLLCFFIALESAYMTRYVRQGKLPVPWPVLRGVEVVVLFLMLRSLVGVLRGPQLEQIVTPGAARIDGELLALILVGALTWLSSWRLASDLLDLEMLDPTLDREIIREVAEEQVQIRRDLIMFTMIIGVALTFLAGLLRMYRRTSHLPDEAALYGLGHIVIYFFLALVLFSRTRLNLLRSGWVWEKVPIGHKVGARWITYTVLLLIAAAIIALLLPTRYSLGLLGTLAYLLNFFIAAIQTIVYVILALLFSLLSRLLPALPPLPPQRQPSPSALNFGVPPPTSAEFVQSLIFWLVFVVVAGYVVIQFLQQHPSMMEWLKRLPGIPFVMSLWRRVRDWLGGLNQSIENMREARRKARQPVIRSAPASRRWINPRKLSPRQQVQFYYLAMLRRGGESGYARKPTQTPYEYAHTLENQIPEIDQDVDGLTEEFIEARYSRHDIPAEHVSVVRRYWERIKQALRR